MQTDQTRPSGGESSRGALRYARHVKDHSSMSEVSDSDEERQKRMKMRRIALSTVNQNELPIVVISSDEEDGSSLSVIAQKGSQPTQSGETMSQALAHAEEARSDSEPEEELPAVTPRRRHGRAPHMHRIVLSSDDESPSVSETRTPQAPAGRRAPRIPDDDVIDLTLSSSEGSDAESPVPPPTKPIIPSKNVGKGTPLKTTQKVRPPAKESDGMLPLFLDDSESEHENAGQEPKCGGDEEGTLCDPFFVDDGAILVLDEPRSAQKPVRRLNPSSNTSIVVPGPSTPRRDRGKSRLALSLDSEEEEEVAMIVKPKSRLKSVSQSGPTTASPGISTLTPKTLRMTKKTLHERELQRRRAYAQAFFDELNELIFGGGIPASTELQWNKRLLTTAGRAHWHRTREGVHETHIQLAEKILDCDERIRNTLSHEMCHLACWIIDEAPTENHGALFKRWANKIMRKRPEIEVTTRHNYDIKCKYEWKCANCAKVYGRHSKSINPDEQACGVCKTGMLVPQFETRRAPPRTPKAKADSLNAAVRSRDSPIAMPGAFPSPSPAKKTAAKTHASRTSIEISGNGDSDVEILAHTLKGIRIDGKSGLI